MIHREPNRQIYILTARQPIRLFQALIIILSLVFLLLSDKNAFADTPRGLVSGIITSRQNGEPLPNCNIVVDSLKIGTVSDSLGMFVLPLPFGKHHIEFNFLGFKKESRVAVLTASSPLLRLKIRLIETPLAGDKITVEAEQSVEESHSLRIERKDIERIPTTYSDVYRTIKILPGVTSNNELSSAYNVRGGNYDENLIFLNGYEVWRPFLLRSGVEENLSLVNPLMVKNLDFYNGVFPVRYGGKLSSALNVEYQGDFDRQLHGTASGNLFNFGLNLNQHWKKLNWSAGFRYADPSLFVTKLQTGGDYRPLFLDGQLLLNYRIDQRSQLEIFLLSALNRFNLLPDKWTGNYKTDPFGYDVRGVEIRYQGNKNYNYYTTLAGIRYKRPVNRQTFFTLSLARYASTEKQDDDLTGFVYYVPDAREPDKNNEFLKSRYERVHNRLTLVNYEPHIDLVSVTPDHNLEAGISGRFSRLKNTVNEYYLENGENVLELPIQNYRNQYLDFNDWSAYLQDEIRLLPVLKWQVGIRTTHSGYTREQLWSPRTSLDYRSSPLQTFSLSFGSYYQPPFFHELQNLQKTDRPLKSQQAIHYVLGWDRRFANKTRFKAELYYKKLRHIIPYYQDQMTLVYLTGTQASGYTYGLDLLIQGEIKEGLNSWIGYSYLNSKEKWAGESFYRRRPLDQHHTFRVFLQDKMPNHPNIQAHVRLLFGSGFLYHPQKAVLDPLTGQRYLQVNLDRLDEFSPYFRVDMGLSARLRLWGQQEGIFTAEVLNVFNHINMANYSWFEVQPGQIVRIPHIYTRRFLNLGAEIYF